MYITNHLLKKNQEFGFDSIIVCINPNTIVNNSWKIVNTSGHCSKKQILINRLVFLTKNYTIKSIILFTLEFIKLL